MYRKRCTHGHLARHVKVYVEDGIRAPHAPVVPHQHPYARSNAVLGRFIPPRSNPSPDRRVPQRQMPNPIKADLLQISYLTRRGIFFGRPSVSDPRTLCSLCRNTAIYRLPWPRCYKRRTLSEAPKKQTARRRFLVFLSSKKSGERSAWMGFDVSRWGTCRSAMDRQLYSDNDQENSRNRSSILQHQTSSLFGARTQRNRPAPSSRNTVTPSSAP